MKNIYVSGLSNGIHVDDVFLVGSKSLCEARNGSQYIKVQLADRTGMIEAFKWDADEALYRQLPSDDFVHIRGVVRDYNGKLQVTIDTFRNCSHKVDSADFLPKCPLDPETMLAELLKIVESVRHPHLRALLDHFFSDAAFLSKFTTAPAAMKIHHAYIGGLLEHSLSSAKMCDMVAGHYSGIDRELLITGALLHDIGKVEEFNWDKSIKYSDNGHLVGHIVGGAMMVRMAVDSIEGFHPLLKLKMVHMVLAHHGQKDFGSPKRPKSLESLVLHYVEDLDAKVNTFQQALAKSQAEGDTDLWTEKNWVFERPLFRGMPRSIMEPGSVDGGSIDSLIEDYDPFEEE